VKKLIQEELVSKSKRREAILPLPPATAGGLIAAILAILLVGFSSQRASDSRSEAAKRFTHTFQVVEQLTLLVSTLKDAETGQRGYLLTGEEKYLGPFSSAQGELDLELKQLRSLTADNRVQQQRLDVLEPLISGKMAELSQTIRLHKAGDAAGAAAIVRSDQGLEVMDRIRGIVADMDQDERESLGERERDWQDARDLSNLVNVVGSGALLLFILGAAFLLSRDHKARETEAWLKTGQAGALVRLQGEDSLQVIGENALQYLSGYLEALVSTMYVAEEDGTFRRIAALALPANLTDTEVRPGEGLIGQALKDRRPLHVREVPADYLPISSTVGSARGRELLVVPLLTDGEVLGALELGFFRKLETRDLELMARLAEPLGFAIASARYKARLRDLLEESQRQAEELESQQSEMEAQQAELEATNEEISQTNALMEVQTEELERQRDDLSAAREQADKASRYKSEFLANMSHELRTPLNSSLILARLLADNREGNLTADQVRSAETIYGAGNDLLVLINDILDLSKIEAGRADVTAEQVNLGNLISAIERAFRPVAAERKLQLRINRAAGGPEQIVTDGRRLEQILKNLLSNAFKFTSKGEVELTVAAEGEEEIRFAVRDTGIGIAPHQQEVIFEAFRQADGTTSRKYGGTGLGLSISRELAHLLGGELTVDSVAGEGSTFTLTLPVDGPPEQAERAAPADTAASPTPPSPAASGRPGSRVPSPSGMHLAVAAGGLAGRRKPRAAAAPTAPMRPSARSSTKPQIELDFQDDRDSLSREGRLILAVEDDPTFARILFDLAHELDFDCAVALTGDDGLSLARELQPSGVLLDIGLPDSSGLSVLERLKRDPSTRHIPIHMVSSSDYEQTALELGAIGYAFKPVAREELIAAFQKLRERHDRSVRRVLLVEDDVRQQESIQKLLGGQGVELITAGSVKEALAQLEKQSIDCMVLDLTLPDGSGHDLLEKMAEGTRYSFPPVIVYTGRDLERADEERLLRYSRSIIVKGARSPERLLDEVTLFLHQVESKLPAEQRRILSDARQREAVFEGRKILIVEDDVRNVFALSKVLEPRGAKVEIARNGREALEVLARIPGIDLVLMDIMMPEMDGLTAMRELRKQEQFRKLPVIALTAKAMADDREQAITAGANDYMAKPFEVDKLISLCRVWLRR
jgi:signal transduction histidine kinase/DNA-binding response OmpR family regulator/CHASE3 domain sensor protein